LRVKLACNFSVISGFVRSKAQTYALQHFKHCVYSGALKVR